MFVSPMGATRVTGRLPDGRDFSAGGWLDVDSELQFEARLKQGGTLAGTLAFGDEQLEEPVAGTLHWLTPDETSVRVIDVRGSRY